MKARAVVEFEWPWNPLEDPIEDAVGRIRLHMRDHCQALQQVEVVKVEEVPDAE